MDFTWVNGLVMLTLQHDLLRIALPFMLYGVFLVSSVTSLYLLCQRSRKTRGIVWMIGVVIVMILLMTLHVTFLYTVMTIRLYPERLASTRISPLTPAQKIVSNSQQLQATLASDITMILNWWLGDSIILWRAWRIARGAGVLNLISSFLYGASLILIIFTAVLAQHPPRDIYMAWKIRIAAYAALLACNVVATFTLLRMNWNHRKLLKGTRHQSAAMRALKTLIEFGVLYCIVQVFNLVFSIVINDLTLNMRTSDPVALRVYYSTLMVSDGIVLPIMTMLSGIVPTLTLSVTTLTDRASTSQSTTHRPSPVTTHSTMRFESRSLRASETPTTDHVLSHEMGLRKHAEAGVTDQS